MRREAPPDRPVSASSLLLLAALLCFALFALLDPLLGFVLFGSDSGEYYRLTGMLLGSGHLPVGGAFTGGYTGWGYAYADFPGLFLLTGSFSASTGASVFASLTVFIPALTALAVLPLFLLFRRIFPQDGVAILGAAFATVAMPRLFSLAHPAPLALGDLFCVGGLWMFVEGRTDRRWYALLGPVSGALILTHHLSSYFFLLSALGTLLLYELYRPGAWSPRFPLRELAFLTAFTVGMLLDWLLYATDFHGVLATGEIPSALVSDPAPLVAAAVALFVLVGVLLRRWRRRSPRPRRVRFPTDRAIVRDGALVSAAIVGGLALLLVLPLPATEQHISPGALLWFSPFALLAAFTGGSRHLIGTARTGPVALAWLVALGASALFALATNNPVLLPSRHAEYLVIPLALLVAATLGYLLLRAEAVYGRRGLLAAGSAIVLLAAANAAIAYPPPSDFGGFQEGLTSGDAALWMWVGLTIPPGSVVATDHRLSSMLFGFDGLYATWQNTPALFTGGPSDWPAAASELRSVDAPHCPYRFPVELVAVDSVMAGGVALDPGAQALPLSATAQQWLTGAPFVPVYLNGGEVVYWVDGPVGAPGAPAVCHGS